MIGFMSYIKTVTSQNSVAVASTVSQQKASATCSVIDSYVENEKGVLVCQMPNGEIHEFYVLDTDVTGVELVTFEMDNLYEIETYRVVDFE